MHMDNFERCIKKHYSDLCHVIDPVDLLPDLTCIGDYSREKIRRKETNEGKIAAAQELLPEIKRHGDQGILQLLKGLHRQQSSDTHKELYRKIYKELPKALKRKMDQLLQPDDGDADEKDDEGGDNTTQVPVTNIGHAEPDNININIYTSQTNVQVGNRNEQHIQVEATSNDGSIAWHSNDTFDDEESPDDEESTEVEENRDVEEPGSVNVDESEVDQDQTYLKIVPDINATSAGPEPSHHPGLDTQGAEGNLAQHTGRGNIIDEAELNREGEIRETWEGEVLVPPPQAWQLIPATVNERYSSVGVQETTPSQLGLGNAEPCTSMQSPEERMAAPEIEETDPLTLMLGGVAPSGQAYVGNTAEDHSIVSGLNIAPSIIGSSEDANIDVDQGNEYDDCNKWSDKTGAKASDGSEIVEDLVALAPAINCEESLDKADKPSEAHANDDAGVNQMPLLMLATVTVCVLAVITGLYWTYKKK